ncbi:MAG: putative bifunctional diguanylate cyclase/phosphodiesterase [Longimicrobiales bacterium]
MSAQSIHVLLVEASAPTGELLRRTLEDDRETRFDVSRAAGVREAVTWLGVTSPDVILLSLELPEARGLAAYALVEAQATGAPIVVLAEPENEATALKALQHGAADYLLKDQLYDTLAVRAVRYALERARAAHEQRRAQEALRESERRYRAFIERSRDAIYMTSRDGRVLELNDAGLELFGYTRPELAWLNVADLYGDAEERTRLQQLVERNGWVREHEVRLRRKDGREIWALITASSRYGPDGTLDGYEGIVHDITDRKVVEAQLLHDALHDTLTGLPNRALFVDRLERVIARWRRNQQLFAVLFLDLDRFKLVNDSLGHYMGDQLLLAVARLLSTCVRAEDTVARLGGDEFAILLDAIDEVADATYVAKRIQQRMAQPFQLLEHEVFTSVSIGITMCPEECEGPEELLRDADTAMYRAKASGRGHYQIFDRQMHAHVVAQLQLETDLRHAVARREFTLLYQPIVSLADGSLQGFEALLRWRHPARGLLTPDAFIEAAEDSGLIVPIGLWVLRHACTQLADWQTRFPQVTPLSMAVNLSPRQFMQPDLVEQVLGIASAAGIQPTALHLEITEGAVMENPELATSTLRRLRHAGVRLCIDDFGTGYSSLSVLHQFPIDTVKIDRSFVKRMGNGGQSLGLVATIVSLARHLGMEPVAEGVETEEQRSRLRAMGSRFGQGFLFATPLEPIRAAAMIAH